VFWGEYGLENFVEYPTTCDATQSEIITSTTCTIPSIVLHETYLLPWASQIWVKVLATNIYGSSERSEAGD
jgi:hypothetical protein